MEQYSKIDYDDKYILKRLMEGITRDEIAIELNHKNYRTIDMYMRRHGYSWNSEKQIYVKGIDSEKKLNFDQPTTGKIKRILSLFDAGMDPTEIAKKLGMKDHRSIATYMKSKGYIWSSEQQNYILLKGDVSSNDKNDNNIELDDSLELDNTDNSNYYSQLNKSDLSIDGMEKFESLLPMLEMINKNKDKLAELLSINSSATIPRYIVGGITITKSLCMSHSLAELIKEFSKEKNISQREIFEVAIIEFLKKYGYESEINTLFS
ncbi:hypothetical protein BD780_000013 [Clostridium tetanomorphum]|uniref:hypothetical protein n=1 Tax=Clostridium tetanomorphum TaxID=1553 RepID=UPI0004515AAC|nr:hypothetical protein [Clostridium tetanomorphum]KAJ52039.1 hypothetical protein CTM_09711 [Clostridium tetanomorphum DSM 665]MBP1862959.1 hypothetical protein [Clostridium tetanomorphum]NRS82788.1 hypothetical protein [Clostridium tetanomorphum]SQC00092.1 Uncharacterised protein [Clostridium tetanomorphum]